MGWDFIEKRRSELNEDDKKTLLLVSGDFSGIQDTVYTISSKGALKSLRARSFMLELLTEHIVYEILQLAGIKTDKSKEYLIWHGAERGVIYSGGGAFSLLLNKSDLGDEIKKFADILNSWAVNEFSGKLFIAIHILPVSQDDISEKKRFQAKRQEQSDELDKLKRRKFWTDDGALLENLLNPEMPVQTDIQKECQITGRDDLPHTEMTDKIAEDFWVSKLSYHLWYLGDKLTDLKEGEKIWRYDYFAVEKKVERGYLCFPTHNNSGLALYTTKKIANKCEKCWKIGDDFLYAYYVRKVGDLSGSEYAQNRELEVIQETKPNAVLDDDIKKTQFLLPDLQRVPAVRI